MKFVALVVVFLCLAAAVLTAEDTKTRSIIGLLGHGAHGPHGAPPNYPSGDGYPGGYSNGGGVPIAPGIPAPPCPKNYLFSCQPSLTPAPCAQGALTYGSLGAYSDNYPVYALQAPQYVNGYQAY